MRGLPDRLEFMLKLAIDVSCDFTDGKGMRVKKGV